MDEFIDSLSRQGRKLKDRLKGKRHKRDRKGTSTAGERGDSSGSLLRLEPRVVAGDHDGEGSGTTTGVPKVRSKDRPPQPKSMPTGRNNDSDLQRELNVDEEGVSQRDLSLDPEVEAAVGSGPSREVEQVEPTPTVPSIPHSGENDGT